jgi:DNA polymerase-1
LASKLLPDWSAYQLLHEGSLALARAEENGLRIDVAYLDKQIEVTNNKIKALNEEMRQGKIADLWRREFGNKMNLGSDPQLARILFGVLKIPCKYRTAPTTKFPAGQAKVDDTVLLEIKHPEAGPYCKQRIKLRQLRDLKNRLVSLRKETIDGLYHANFNLHTAWTYRSSSGQNKEGASRAGSEFNFQNVPVRDADIAPVIRKAFVPRPGCVLVENDFAALEFKGAACFWGDPKMIAYASDPKLDIHRDMAAECYAFKPQQFNKDTRYCGKNGFVFPELYGSYYCQIARNMWSMIDSKKLTVDGMPMKLWLKRKDITELGACNPKEPPRPGTFEYHIKQVEDRFARRFPVFARKKDEWYNTYRQRGQFKMMTGFVCSGLYSKNDTLNAPIQGPCFHCLLFTLIQIHKWVLRNKKRTKILGQIHDCVIADVPKSELQEYLAEVKRIVEVELPKKWKWIIVPMGIEAEVATTTWWDKKVWVEKNGLWQPKEAA